MTITSELYTLEWSKKINSFRILDYDTSVEKNLSALVSNESSDYILVCVGTMDECKARQAKFRRFLQQRM